MSETRPRFGKEEFARRGEKIYERDIHPYLKENDKGKFVAVDIETGEYEIDKDELVAIDRLVARHRDAQIWLMRVGFRYARHFGARTGRTGTMAIG